MKTKTPRVPYFTGWVIWVVCIMTLCIPYAAHNIGRSPGQLPLSNWWWFSIWLIPFAARLAQVYIIREKLIKKWGWPDVRPWSDPLICVDGTIVPIIKWFAISAGHEYNEARRIYDQTPGMKHRVDNDYAKYRQEFRAAYGHD